MDTDWRIAEDRKNIWELEQEKQSLVQQIENNKRVASEIVDQASAQRDLNTYDLWVKLKSCEEVQGWYREDEQKAINKKTACKSKR